MSHAAEAVAHTPLTIKYLRKTAPWKFEGLFLLSIYVSSTSAPRMDHNDRPYLIITLYVSALKPSVVTSNAVHHLNSVPAGADVAEEMEEYKP